MKKYALTILLLLLVSIGLMAQKSNVEIEALIQKYMTDQRGPYKDIRWFCKDGSIIPPKEKCPEPGGVQRARYRDEVVALGKSNHIYLGQILSTTSKEDFLDANQNYSRLKQYQLEKYLRNVDDGWVLRKAQYYRGAFQVEDEEAWDIDFLTWLLAKDELIKKQFFLIRQAVKDIPHQGDNATTQKVRAVSKEISELYASFFDLRVKIHGQPEYADIQRVKDFRQANEGKLNASLSAKFNELIADMELAYQPLNLNDLKKRLNKLPQDASITVTLNEYIQNFADEPSGPAKLMATAETIWAIREGLLSIPKASGRLTLLDVSNTLEEMFFREVTYWEPTTVQDLLDKICYESMTAAGSGFLEEWEWNALKNNLALAQREKFTIGELNHRLAAGRSVVEWGTAMTKATWQDVVNLYGVFEPKAYGFFDDRIRSSVLLSLGMSVGQLGDFISEESNLANKIFDIPNQSHARGLNPGYAKGELVVITGSGEDIEVDKSKIYVFNRPPSDLKPVGGIATVSEGNLVSHVQLLARNLGIPNAVISSQNLESIQAYAGQEVFYAVSKRGTVVMKAASVMTPEEKALFATKTRNENKVTVPADRIQLDVTRVLNMREVDATASGVICGPKAANLGQLKALFPEQVVEGLVIPFGIFRQHLDQDMPGQSVSYWQYLSDAFAVAKKMEGDGSSESEVERYLLEQLDILRLAIRDIKLLPSFVDDLKQRFQNVFGKDIGKIPVFLRSDTNMEDLKEFTGAGLNLTLFNVVDEQKILQGIKDVWASPYTERSFKWRQRYLLNPENVFPSILVIPSVDVDYSGVLITTGVTSGNPDDLTIAFSRGAGGAVDGQAAESYLLLGYGGVHLLSPAREMTYKSLPESGGTKTSFTTLEKPLLNAENILDIRKLAEQVNETLPNTPGIETKGPFDIELGFKDNELWLFQVRPFVENKNASSSAYLDAISPPLPLQKEIDSDQSLKN